MNGLCHEVRSFHGMLFIHDLFFVFGSDEWIDDGDVGERMFLILLMQLLVQV